jgi:hypothetical protein
VNTNLIPNGSFEAGLADWEATPNGVTFVQNEAKRFVMLTAEGHSAAICSEAIDVQPGAAYFVEVERAIRGDCEITVIGASSLLKPDHFGEVIPTERRVRVQVTARPGNRVGIARVLAKPVGARAQIENIRSTAAFHKPGEPFEILCEIKNNGSDALEAEVARLVTRDHDLMEERTEAYVPMLGAGESATASWSVQKQRLAYAPFEIEFEYPGGLIRAKGATLRHTPTTEPRTVQSVAGGRRWFCVAGRKLRFIGHETDLEYGPGLLTTPEGVNLGVLRQFGQIVEASGGVLPLWSKLRRLSPAGAELSGKNDVAEWDFLIRPDHASRGIAVELRLRAKKRLQGCRIEVAPFQTELPMRSSGASLELTTPKGLVFIAWSTVGRLGLSFEAFDQSGLATFRSERLTLGPGTPIRAVVSISPADRAIRAR